MGEKIKNTPEQREAKIIASLVVNWINRGEKTDEIYTALVDRILEALEGRSLKRPSVSDGGGTEEYDKLVKRNWKETAALKPPVGE